MAKSDLVPCFYKEQNATWERPAKLLPRCEVRELKAQKIGEFIFNGRAFRFFQTVAHAIASCLWDGPFGIGNLLPFSKHQNPLMFPERLHYPIPAVGARGRWRTVHRVMSAAGYPEPAESSRHLSVEAMLIGSARQRTPSYIRALADRGYGKVPQHLGLENPDGAPLNFNLNVKFIASRHKKETSSGQS